MPSRPILALETLVEDASARIYEFQTDEVFGRRLRDDHHFVAQFLALVGVVG